MTSTCFSLVRGRAMRVTKLDGCGRVATGVGSAVVVTEGFISVGFTPNNEEGETISVTNAAGNVCVLDEPAPRFTGYNIEVAFCGVDPELFSLMTGMPVVMDAQGANAIGLRVNSGVDVANSGFAMELWSNVPVAACDESGGATYGYLLIPFVKGGVLGDFTVENGAVNFTLTGAVSKDGSEWGVGPFDVVRAAGTAEEQTVTITGTPTGGTFTLTYDGQETAPIAYNATASTVATALNALNNLSGVTATGGPLPGSAVTVTFGETDAAEMTADDTALTGGTAPAVAVATATPGALGAASPLLEPIDPRDHLHMQLTTVAPPTPTCGAVTLA